MTRQDLRSHYVVDRIVEKYKCVVQSEPTFNVMLEPTTEATYQTIDDRSYEQVS